MKQKYETELLKDVLDIKNPSWVFVSWEELFNKIDKINKILDKIRSQRYELEILIKTMLKHRQLSKMLPNKQYSAKAEYCPQEHAVKQQQHGSRRKPTGTTDTVCDAVQSAVS